MEKSTAIQPNCSKQRAYAFLYFILVKSVEIVRYLITN